MMDKLTPNEYRDISKFIAATESDYVTRAESYPRMSDALFNQIREGVANAIEQFTPSPSKGNTSAFHGAVANWIKVCGSTPEAYWYEVWVRSGRKSLGAYNGPRVAAS